VSGKWLNRGEARPKTVVESRLFRRSREPASRFRVNCIVTIPAGCPTLHSVLSGLGLGLGSGLGLGLGFDLFAVDPIKNPRPISTVGGRGCVYQDCADC